MVILKCPSKVCHQNISIELPPTTVLYDSKTAGIHLWKQWSHLLCFFCSRHLLYMKIIHFCGFSYFSLWYLVPVYQEMLFLTRGFKGLFANVLCDIPIFKCATFDGNPASDCVGNDILMHIVYVAQMSKIIIIKKMTVSISNLLQMQFGLRLWFHVVFAVLCEQGLIQKDSSQRLRGGQRGV